MKPNCANLYLTITTVFHLNPGGGNWSTQRKQPTCRTLSHNLIA